MGIEEIYGKRVYGINRVTYILDENHIITDVIDKVKTKSHACDILDII